MASGSPSPARSQRRSGSSGNYRGGVINYHLIAGILVNYHQRAARMHGHAPIITYGRQHILDTRGEIQHHHRREIPLAHYFLNHPPPPPRWAKRLVRNKVWEGYWPSVSPHPRFTVDDARLYLPLPRSPEARELTLPHDTHRAARKEQAKKTLESRERE